MGRIRIPPLNEGVPAARMGGRLPFRPYQVAETGAWFTARAGVTDVSGKASAWTSQYPGGTYTATQATAGKRPTIAAGINGRPSLLFASASSQDMANTTQNIVASGVERYVLIVGKAISPGGGFFTFRSGNTGGTAPVWALLIKDGGGFAYYYTDTVANNLNDGSLPDYLNPFVIEYELEAGEAAVVRFNNAVRTAAGGTVDAETGADGFRIGSATSASQLLDGHIADIYIASPIPSAADKAKLRAFFASANGITL